MSAPTAASTHLRSEDTRPADAGGCLGALAARNWPWPRGGRGGRIMKALIRLCLLLIMLGLCGSAGADGYPDRPIHMVVPFPPGGPAGVVADAVCPELGKRLGQSVIIDNISGADGIVGSDFVAKAPPDGYTLLLASSAHVLHPS